jgi:hypothetical protein
MLLDTAGDGSGADASKTHEGNTSLGFCSFFGAKGQVCKISSYNLL